MTTQPNQPEDTPRSAGVEAVLEEVRDQVKELTSTLWAARDTGELMGAVAQIEALKSTLHGLELAVVHELDATGAV